MKIAYLLADTELAGGIRVATAHADVLTKRGHDVTLVTPGGPLTWRASRAQWLRVHAFSDLDARDFDFVVGTFWTTLHDTYALAGNRGLHLCQGYEGSFSFYQHQRAQIDAAYRLPLPKITVSPHLVPICRAFYDDATYIGQIVDNEFYQPHDGGRASRPPTPGILPGVSSGSTLPGRMAGSGGRDARPPIPRVLLVGPLQADFKGIDVGYAAVRHARSSGADFDLVRASQWGPAEDEPTQLASEFHVALHTDGMAKLIASCDVFLATSRAEEGFGLPAAEAMAGGLPGVLTEIPSFLSWDERRDYALFAPEGDGVAAGEQLARLVRDRALAEHVAARGRAVVEQFRAERTGERLERYLVERR